MPKTGKYPSQMTDDEIDAYVRSSLEVRRPSISSSLNLQTIYHTACTTRMGRESEGAVVDPATLKIHGIDGIRVCDASIFPILPAGCVNAAQALLSRPSTHAPLSRQSPRRAPTSSSPPAESCCGSVRHVPSVHRADVSSSCPRWSWRLSLKALRIGGALAHENPKCGSPVMLQRSVVHYAVAAGRKGPGESCKRSSMSRDCFRSSRLPRPTSHSLS